MLSRKYNRIVSIICVVMIVLMCFSLGACSGKSDNEKNTVKYKEVSDFNGKTVASQTGTVFDDILNGSIKNLKHKYYNDTSSMILALRNGYVDAIGLDEPNAKYASVQNPDLGVFDKVIETDTYAFAMTKDSVLTDRISDVIKDYSEDGTLDSLKEKWFSGDMDKMRINMDDYSGYDAPNGTIRYIHDSTQVPMDFVDDNGDSAGYEVELMLMIAKRLGMNVEITQASFDSLIIAVSSGTADVASGSISVTEERRELVDFSESHYEGGIVLLCRSKDLLNGSSKTDKDGFFEKVSVSFNKTFVRANRWSMILSGIAVTLIIAVSSLILGTILGLIICSLRRSKNRFTARLTAIVIRFIQGIPVVVLLMIFYYLVFASSGLNGIMIAIIGFSVNFGVNSAEIIRSGIESVGKTQWEASRCLGLTKFQTFRKVIFPQSVIVFLPAFKSEFINMLKMTSVVGYIAVQDITKAFDLIRSRTLDAFFPLLTNTVIYIFLAWSLALLIGLVEFRFNPQKRHRKYKNRAKPARVNSDDFLNTSNVPEKKVVQLKNVVKEYETNKPILYKMNASVNSGDIVAIIGGSGSGKSTLLRLVSNLEKPTYGEVLINGKNINGPKADLSVLRKTGMVFQSFELFPHLTVIENVMLAPRTVLNLPMDEAYSVAYAFLKSVGMAERAYRYPNELSGGQKQRVAIARTLAMRPEIILFDEPTSALDPASTNEVLSVIRSLASKGYTMLIVTHEMSFAKEVSNKVFYVAKGEIYESGTPEQIFNSPQKELTRKFIYNLNTFETVINSEDFDFIGVNSGISEFGKKYEISKEITEKTKVIFEELGVQMILPFLEDNIELLFLIEYSEKDQTAALYFRYNGREFDPLENGDKTPLALVENYSDKITRRYDPNSTYSNEIIVTVSK